MSSWQMTHNPLEITLYWGKFESVTENKALVMNGERDEYYKYCHESGG